MARNKTDLRHPAAWVHSTVHAVLLGLALGWFAGLVLGLLHLLIDTRVPLRWWQTVFQQTNGPGAQSVALWVDQALHITTIAMWVALALSEV